MVLRAYIRKPDSAGLSRIVICFNNKGKQWIKTNIKVLPSFWDQEAQYIKSGQPKNKELNSKLAERKTEIKTAIQKLLDAKIDPTTATVTGYLAPKKVVVAPSSPTLSFLLSDYVTANTGRLKPGYLRRFTTIARSIDGYKEGLLAEDFTLEELNKYVSEYLIEACNVENNTIHDYVRRIKFVMERAERRRLISNTDCLDFSYKYIQPKPFWLDWTDVEKIEAFEPFPHDLIYKEDFLFRCYTGLRWSDAVNLRPEHFIKKDGKVYYDFHVIKTSLSQNIEMSPKASEILKKWGYRIPKLYQSDCNEKIKAIARGAKIDDVVEKVRFVGSERIVEMLPKHKLVTTHVARRTFARRWMDLGGDIGKLSKYLGHSSIDQTSSYVGYTTKEVNDELRKLMG
jgi:integrase